jgi:hypothetical protein
MESHWVGLEENFFVERNISNLLHSGICGEGENVISIT